MIRCPWFIRRYFERLPGSARRSERRPFQPSDTIALGSVILTAIGVCANYRLTIRTQEMAYRADVRARLVNEKRGVYAQFIGDAEARSRPVILYVPPEGTPTAQGLMATIRIFSPKAVIDAASDCVRCLEGEISGQDPYECMPQKISLFVKEVRKEFAADDPKTTWP